MMWLDGTPVTGAELGGLALVNYGHFTSMRVDDGRARGLRLHLERLVRDCRTLFGAALDPAAVRALARAAVAASPDPAVVLRVTVFDPELGLGRPGAPARPRVLVTLRPVPDDHAEPVRLRSVRYVRELPEVKHTGLFGTVRQRRSAQLAGYDDALFVAADGRIAEGPTWNIAFLDPAPATDAAANADAAGDPAGTGRLTWPGAETLTGVTMRLLGAAAGRLGVTERTAGLTLADLPGRYAAVITNAAIGVRPVGSVDGVELPTAPALTEALREAYQRVEPEPL